MLDAESRSATDVEASTDCGSARSDRLKARPQGHDGVPDAEELNTDRLKRIQRRLWPLLVSAPRVDLLHDLAARPFAAGDNVGAEELGEVVGVALRRQAPCPVDETSQRPRGRGPAAEPEDEDLVALLVVEDETIEGVFDIAFEARAPCAPERLVGD